MLLRVSDLILLKLKMPTFGPGINAGHELESMVQQKDRSGPFSLMKKSKPCNHYRKRSFNTLKSENVKSTMTATLKLIKLIIQYLIDSSVNS
jgi:hypothetical protein